jgi:hypothetical protein
MKLKLSRCLMVLGILAIARETFAHHRSRVPYDLTKTVTLKGTVKEFVYVNPHGYITFEVKDDQGLVTERAAETDIPIGCFWQILS